MSDLPLTVYGTTWCGDCDRSKQVLKQYQVPFQEINIEESEEATQFVLDTNNKVRGQEMQSVPVIAFPNGKILIEPTRDVLVAALVETGFIPSTA